MGLAEAYLIRPRRSTPDVLLMLGIALALPKSRTLSDGTRSRSGGLEEGAGWRWEAFAHT